MACCAHPECNKEGKFPAPRDPRNLGQRQYFCEEHIKEFNKRWNGLEGFGQDEIFSMQNGGATWDRPTWSMGVNGSANGAKIHEMFDSAEDLFKFFKQRRTQEMQGETQFTRTHHHVLPPDVKEACIIFNLEKPDNEVNIKRKYIKLVKENHPDVNQGSETSQDQIKKINVAFKILTDYVQREAVA